MAHSHSNLRFTCAPFLGFGAPNCDSFLGVPTPLNGLADRRLSPILDALAQDEPVIALHGPRSVGKSTLLHIFAASHGVPVLDLDDIATRDAVLANPSVAVGQRTPICLDEYQRAPEVLARVSEDHGVRAAPVM